MTPMEKGLGWGIGTGCEGDGRQKGRWVKAGGGGGVAPRYKHVVRALPFGPWW